MLRAASCVIACVVAGLAASGAPAQPRIVGGSLTAVTAVPWQVAVKVDTGSGDYLCGGVILDATHILTAAHCVVESESRDSVVRHADAISVEAGTTHLSPEDPAAVKPGVTSVAPDPMYDGTNYDAAVLTLAAALPLGSGTMAAISMAGAPPVTGDQLTVSGWGLTSETASTMPHTLRFATVNVTDFDSCQKAYARQTVTLLPGAVICAAATDPARDSCRGDSGGPLFDSSRQLVGIVSSGIGCAQAAFPGIYTSVTDPDVQSFIADQTAPGGPTPPPHVTGAGPVLTGAPRVGETVTCSSGDWSGNPALEFTFVDHQVPSKVFQSSGENTFVLSTAQLGRSIGCHVRASNVSNVVVAKTNSLGPVTDVSTPPPGAQGDRTPPESEIASSRCTRTQCVVRIRVFDGSGSGVAGVEAIVRTITSSSCVLRPRSGDTKRRCSRVSTRRLAAQRVHGGDFTITASHLPSGIHRFNIRAVDRAGNRQIVATPLTRTTRS